MPAMKTIVWDLDDVLNDFTARWLESGWKAEHPDCRVAFEDLRSNPPLTELNATQAEYLDSLDRFRVSEIARSLQPNRAIANWFETHGSRFRHHVLTARPLKTVAPAAEWVFAHFGKWIRHFHFVPSPRPDDVAPDYDRTKGSVLQRLGGVDFFVDDSITNVTEAGQLGVRAFAFPQPWNHREVSVSDILATFSNSLSR